MGLQGKGNTTQERRSTMKEVRTIYGFRDLQSEEEFFVEVSGSDTIRNFDRAYNFAHAVVSKYVQSLGVFTEECAKIWGWATHRI